MLSLPEMTITQYSIVYNILSFTIAAMTASFVYFLLTRREIAPRYKLASTASALVVFIAAYHYLRIFQSWEGAFQLVSEGGESFYKPVGIFNDAYRYMDWALTVPLLMVELVVIMSLTRARRAKLMTTLVIAAFLMIILGYPGELQRQAESVFSMRGLWGLLSTIPFVFILFVLFKEIKREMGEQQDKQSAVLFRNIGLLTLLTWGFYPIAYMAPFYGLSGAQGEVFLQVGYSIADVLAKCGYGILIHVVAVRLSKAESGETSAAPASNEAAAATA